MGISQGVDSVRTGVCTSTTRPASPYVGQMIFETDTNYIKIYTASGWSTGMRQSTSFVASYLIVAGGGGGGGGNGGGGGGANENYNGGAGGSGIVIIKYQI